MCSKGFSVDDLTNMLNIIETCTRRGAFQAAELSGVGAFYDKLKQCKDSLSDNKVTDKCVGSCEELKNEVEEVGNQVEEVEKVEKVEELSKEEERGDVCSGGKCYLSPSTIRV